MALENEERTLTYLTKVEKLADEILADKHEIVMIDKRRNSNREALREIGKSAQKKGWITVGSVLMKHTFDDAKSLLEADQKQLDIDINLLRSNMKIKVNNLRDLEMQPPVPGLMLVPISNKETNAFKDAGLIPRHL